MVMIEVKIKAELENVTDFQPVDIGHNWNFRVECSSCRVLSKKVVSVCALDEMQMSGGRDTANMVIKCHFCKRESSLDIAEGPFPYTAENSGSMATILIVDCRGVDLKEFEPRSGWKVTGIESNKVFDEVDLAEMEWYDYDDEATVPVSIKDIEYEFAVSKKKDIKKNKNKNKDAANKV